jgi:hypothetical protein
MERRINLKIESYITEFKDKIRDKAKTLGMSNENSNHLLEYIYDYDRLCFSKEDFLKRKRVKNVVPHFDRCSAKRANGEQCTRRKKTTDLYCGTHLKGTPNGIVDENNEPIQNFTQKVEVWAQDIQGILYYIDKNNNVYKAEDIIGNKLNPSIIAKYVKTGEIYSIPVFGI